MLREYLPDSDPYHVWPNIVFTAPDRSTNEIDALVFTPRGVFVVELKHWQGDVGGGGTVWVRRPPNGRLTPEDSPYYATDLKAKRLRSLLEHHARRLGVTVQVPRVHAIVFLHAQHMTCTLDQISRTNVFAPHGHPSGLDSLKDFLNEVPRGQRQLVDAGQSRQLADLVARSGIRQSVAKRRIGQLVLHPKPFAEGLGWQDFLAGHSIDTEIVRRVRFYLVNGADDHDRAIIERAAEREFRLLQGIRHPGIAHPVDLAEHALGLAVVFEHAADSMRLDQWLIQQVDLLSLAQKLRLIQDLAEIVDHAHARRLTHRALHPRAVYVSTDKRQRPSLLVTDWQTAKRLPSTLHSTRVPSSDPADLEMLFDDEARRYQAPEAATNARVPGIQLDVFALGAIAFRIITGREPAENADQLLAAVSNAGLDPAAVVDGLPSDLVDLVYLATHGDPQQRLKNVKEFREKLDLVWEKITAPEPEPVTDPLEAQKGDILDGGLTVIKRLGSGATAVALLVSQDGRELVLKVARDEQHRQRLADEAEALGRVQHAQVASLEKGPIEVWTAVGPRTALLLESAGATTLAEELQGGRLSLEPLSRYGRDLLNIVAYLDVQNVWHRDIKPANLAIRPLPRNKELHLCAFDFSLAAAPADQLKAGTPPYLDPFLGAPERPRYDAAAERFAAAVTLYEMAVGAQPVWGENANPKAISDEVTIESASFDPAVAEELAAFFRRALARSASDRFHTIEEMIDAWRSAFTDIAKTPSATAGVSATLTEDSALDGTGLTARARSALEEKLDIHTVGELLAYDVAELRRARGIPNAARSEIIEYIRKLRKDPEPAEAEESDEAQPKGIEAVCKTLLPKRTTRNANEWDTMRALLGLASVADGTYLRWPTQPEVAKATGQSQTTISGWQRKYAKKWFDTTAVSSVREEIVAFLDTRGGVMSAAELAEALAAGRGMYTTGPGRLPQAIGLVRAAVEAELTRRGDSRVQIHRFLNTGTVLVGREPDDPAAEATAQDLIDYAKALGKKASDIAAADPLLSRQRALEQLRAVTVPADVPLLNDQRLLQLAAVASNGDAAVSAQGQLYPVGMSAERAVRLTAGSLSGQKMTTETVNSRVRSRFPAAAPLPDRPELDRLLKTVGLEWNPDNHEYSSKTSPPSATALRSAPSVAPLTGKADTNAIDEKIAAVIGRKGFLVALTRLSMVEDARRALLKNYPFTELDVTATMLEQLRALDFPWEAIAAADTGAPGDPDFRSLTDLIQHKVMPAIREVLDTETPILITEAAPLARYGQMRLFQELNDPTRPRPAARLLLAPASRVEPAMLDGVQVPLTSPASQSLWLPEPWIEPKAEGAAR